jgi:DNA ligase-1
VVSGSITALTWNIPALTFQDETVCFGGSNTYRHVMDYAELVRTYGRLADTTKTLEKRSILAECFETTDPELLPAVVRLVRGRVFAPWEPGDPGVSSSLASEAIVKTTGIDADRLETWYREEGDLGDAAAKAVGKRTQQTLVSKTLSAEGVYETLRELSTYEGTGSQTRQVDTVAGLVSDADPEEARYLVRTVVGAMRLGVGDGLVRDALADAVLDGSESAVRAVERAYEMTNDFAVVAERARAEGRDGLDALDVEVFRPIKAMLAGTADTLDGAIADLEDDTGTAHVEVKYDGVRAKLHHRDGETRMFTRQLEAVTEQFPDVIEAVERNITADSYIVEAELVGYDPETDEPVPFQTLSKRIKRKHDIAATAASIPVWVYCFDLLYLNGKSYLETPLRDRLEALSGILTPEEGVIERAEHARINSVDSAETFYEAALEAGHEGAMVKNLDATYQPGSRVGYQLKIKPTMEPLDLVVTRAKWSQGRKSDFLGRPYLACRGPDGEFLEVGRMHTGFTDEDLEEFTDLLEPLIESVDGREADLRPEVVVEAEHEEIQESSTYDSGYALRFPRFRRIRRDLAPENADTLERVESLYNKQE